MTEDDMRAKIAAVINMLKADKTQKMTPPERQMADAMIIGAELLGELLIDIKRSANALESIVG
jgi:hypothetical protein